MSFNYMLLNLELLKFSHNISFFRHIGSKSLIIVLWHKLQMLHNKKKGVIYENQTIIW